MYRQNAHRERNRKRERETERENVLPFTNGQPWARPEPGPG